MSYGIIFGLLAALVISFTYVRMYVVRDASGHTTLSAVGASRKQNYVIFGVGLLISGVFVFLFVRLWLLDALQLPRAFLYITGIATLVLQPVIAIVPLKGKAMARIHDTATYLQCSLVPLLCIMIAMSPVLPLAAQLICWAILGFMLYLLVEFRKNFLKPRFILVQMAYAASFYSVLLAATVSKLITG